MIFNFFLGRNRHKDPYSSLVRTDNPSCYLCFKSSVENRPSFDCLFSYSSDHHRHVIRSIDDIRKDIVEKNGGTSSATN